MDLNSLQEALKGSPVSQFRALNEVGSTNDEGLQWLEQDAPDFSLVIADRQTKGRGRFDRKWVTQPGASLAFTVIFRLTDEEKKAPLALYAPLCGLAVWQALHDHLGLFPQIKWPNDVLLDRQKCCGILVEAPWTGDQLKGIVLGIGINITTGSLPPNDSALFPATWIEKHTGKPVERFTLLAKVLESMNYWRVRLGTDEFFASWQQQLAFRGEQVRIEQEGKPSLVGQEIGIDTSGNLLLLTASGAKISIEVGDVHLRSAI